ncbi:MAG: metallophosphoesterase [Chitinophagaceae bacterium]|nr:metallophosphoesterase [Chitinophagaceae bacterium]
MSETGDVSMAGIRKQFDYHPNTLFIAGQEHSLQLLNDGKHYHIINGASSYPSRVGHGKKVEYASSNVGFAVLEILKEKKARVIYYQVSGDTVKQIFIKDIADFSSPVVLGEDTATKGMIKTDSVNAIANANFTQTTSLQRFLIGNNYRQIWGTSVKLRVFNLARENNGLEIKGPGGRHESIGINLEDKKGRTWALRSVNKNVQKMVPEGYKGTVVNDIVNDMLSAQIPYGGTVVSGLLEPLSITHPNTQTVFVPNDTSLGKFRPLLANTVCHFEERKPGFDKVFSTYETINKMIDDGQYNTDQKEYLKCRMVDFLIADFDRHYAQWCWGVSDSSGKKIFHPIPRDRDQAFYKNDGLIMKMAIHGKFAFMINFQNKIKHIKNYGLAESYMDMYFLNQLSENDWQSTLSEFKKKLTDSVISAAVRRLPPEIYAMQGSDINSRLISRREELYLKWPQYYKFISKKVNILGNNDNNLFKVSKDDSGLSVRLFTKEDNGEINEMYARHFDPTVTKEIRLYGFNGNDYFDIDETAVSKIKLRIIGGKGQDTFNIRGNAKNWIYDLSNDTNTILSNKHTTKMFSRKYTVNDYQFQENIYNSFQFPAFSAGLNQNGTVYAGLGMKYETKGFRKLPYASKQELINQWTFSNRSYRTKYKGEFIDLCRSYDLVPETRLDLPTLNYFFGFGNETKRSNNVPIEYYHTRYNVSSTDVLLRKRLLPERTMSLSAGPSIFYYWINSAQGKSTVLESPTAVGLDSQSVNATKIYGGGKIVFAFNNLNSELIPENGINWKTECIALRAVNKESSSITSVTSAADIYARIIPDTKLITALHVGGGHIFSRSFQYFQALTLGGNNYLRGFSTQRFAGSSMLYGSVELKVKLCTFNAYILKSDLGLVGFNDLGRVWMDNEQSGKWHHGFGGGIYLIPFNTAMISLLLATSEESTLIHANLGTKINVTFQ